MLAIKTNRARPLILLARGSNPSRVIRSKAICWECAPLSTLAVLAGSFLTERIFDMARSQRMQNGADLFIRR